MPKSSLAEFAKSFISSDPVTKALSYYELYDEYFHKNDFVPKSILEIGVYKGESTKVFSRVFPNSKIVAVDLNIQEIDFSDFPNVTYLQVDQTDEQRLVQLIKKQFPDGIDLVIEDASHLGAFSYITFFVVFPFVTERGVYIIEDWGTGYWEDWPDGEKFHSLDFRHSKRLKSHDYGMVGFVKCLVDLTHETAIRRRQNDSPKYRSRLESLEFREGMCIARKAVNRPGEISTPEIILVSPPSRVSPPSPTIKYRIKCLLRGVRYLFKF